MVHRGVEFTVTAVSPDIWKYEFRLGDAVVAGNAEAKLGLLAIRRAQMRINRELKRASAE